MGATRKYREKYATRTNIKAMVDNGGNVISTNIYGRSVPWTPAGSKDVLKLCQAVDQLTMLVESMLLNTNIAAYYRDRMNMILMRLER